MSTLKLNLKYCYGIGRLEHELVFEDNSRFAIIYAPNGMMKTSFAKTMMDYSVGKKTQDQIDSTRTSSVSIVEDNGHVLDRKSVYVVDAEQATIASGSITKFLASNELKSKYDAIVISLSDSLKAFYERLKEVSRSSDCSREIRSTFGVNPQESDFEILERIASNIDSVEIGSYSFKYNDIFDNGGKVKKFVTDNASSLQKYFECYHNVLRQSSFFKQGSNSVFGTEQADSLIKGLDKGSFFDVGHELVVSGEKITSVDQIKDLRNAELNRVVNDPNVKAIFLKIDKMIGANTQLREFKAVIFNHNEYLIELLDYDSFRRKVWYSFINTERYTFDTLIGMYQEKKAELEEIYRQAEQEQSAWHSIVSLFNARFNAPFEVRIENQRSIICNREDAILKFYYQEQGVAISANSFSSEFLIESVFSRGEAKAFIILQILFEIESRKNSPLLLVLDDVVDSFDYKNKYAFIEYLNDFKNNANIRVIILTHNLDFYRIVSKRIGIGYNQAWIATKSADSREIKLNRGQFLRSLISSWIKNPKRRVLIAMITFVRNIIEYTRGESDPDYLLLTSCLHNIQETHPKLRVTRDICVRDVLTIYKEVIPRLKNPDAMFDDLSKKWIEVVIEEAELIISANNLNEVDLENKVILAMAARLYTECYVENKLHIAGKMIAEPEGNRLGELVSQFRHENIGTDIDNNLVTRVSLMTPEHIHLNSFMYEPLVDTSVNSLKKLYQDIRRVWPDVSLVGDVQISNT